MIGRYTYYAFISYKHEDEKWAVWLQRQLQSYRLSPSVRRNHPELPARLTPVFLDKTNLTPGILDDGLKDEVQASKYLIVICSRHAHENSRFLDDEIGYFLEGGADISRIIPFIVDPSEQPEKTCFPGRLQDICEERSILGANIHEGGSRRALLKVIAYMHGLRLEEIESEDRRRRKRMVMRAAAAAVVLLAASAAGIWHYWDYYVPKTRYYVDYTERYGVPEGIGALDREEAVRTGERYAIVSSRHKVRELRHENSYGRICPPPESEDLERPARAVYEYGEDGGLHRVICYDENDIPVLSMDYVNESTVDLTQYGESDAYAEAAFLRSHMTANGNALHDLTYSGAKSSIVRYLVDYDENGFVKEVRYVSNPLHNLAAADADGAGGIRYVRDEKGRPVRLQYIACVGESRCAAVPEDYVPAGIRGGVYELRYQYDGQDNLTEYTYIGEDGKPVTSAWNLASESLEYDEYHNMIRNVCCGVDGELSETPEGCAVIERTLDERGNIEEEQYLDRNLQNTEIIYGYYFVKREMDEYGNVVKESYFDREGNPTADMTGTAVQTCVYDEAGRKTEMRKYGPDGEPVLNNYGVFCTKSVYDERGNITEIDFLGTDEKPVLCRDGAAILKEDYDEAGNPVLVRTFGPDGEPVVCVFGYAQMAQEYDSRGNLSRVRYLDENGEPMLNNEGLSSVEKVCDERGNITRLSYFGKDGEPVESNEGVAILEQSFDDYGNLCVCACYGADGLPAVNVFGYARMEMEYDARAHMTEQRIYGTDGEPADNAYGWSVWKGEYNLKGDLIRSEYSAADGTILLSETAPDEKSPDGTGL